MSIKHEAVCDGCEYRADAVLVQAGTASSRLTFADGDAVPVVYPIYGHPRGWVKVSGDDLEQRWFCSLDCLRRHA